MSIDQNGAIVDSIPSKCVNYDPDFTKKIGVKCSKLGDLYSCKNSSCGENCGSCKNRL